MLPFMGIAIGLGYQYWGKQISAGNNLVIEEIQAPSNYISWLMAPLIYLSTLMTHLVGGSAGREGTAIQMSASLNDQLSRLFHLDSLHRKTLLLASVAAGFASVFGTPLAGCVFALEFAWIGSISYGTVLPILLVSFGADLVTQNIWHVDHTSYFVYDIPTLSILNIGLTLVAGTLMGITALSYTKLSHWINTKSKTLITNDLLRIFIGGFMLLGMFSILHFFFKNDRYLGLGIETIQKAFEAPAPSHDFILKIVLTAFTLGIGFKGGEVTPLFFIGATLGSALAVFIPLPVALLAAMGFVAVFAGCARTPFACIIMGIELFGAATIPYVSIACFVAYFIAKNEGIYTAQKSNYFSAK
jgi:H+/Cl- antiporter ClcA